MKTAESILKEILPIGAIKKDEPMSKHVSFKCGGKAAFFAAPENREQLCSLVGALSKNGEKYFVMGNGSNLLVSDSGYEGVVICLGANFSEIRAEDEEIVANAGALLSRIASVALKNSLAGFEFASGIPGSLGGAVVMNAGAYGGEMKDVVVQTDYVSKNGEIRTFSGDEHGFSYRHSNFESGDAVICSRIKLKRGNEAEIRALMNDFNSRRREKQPLEYPSAGSTFKRPEGYFAAKLIDDAGLRGAKCGGAMVSEKHCGFVINYANATSGDVYNLMQHVKKEVFEKFGVELQPEVRLLGEF